MAIESPCLPGSPHVCVGFQIKFYIFFFFLIRNYKWPMTSMEALFFHQLNWLCCTARGFMLRIHCLDQSQSVVLSLLGKMNSHEAALFRI